MKPVKFLVIILLAGCATNSDRISQAWFAQWTEREATYKAEVERLTGTHDIRKADFFESALSNVSNDDLQNRLIEYWRALYHAARMRAQLTVLSAFLEYLNGAPTRGMVATWLEDKAHGVTQEYRYWERDKAALISRGSSKEYLLQASDLTLKSGTIIGVQDEVVRLARETEVFLAELDVASQAQSVAWQQFATGLQQIGQTLQTVGDRQREIHFQERLLYELRQSRSPISPDTRLRTVCQQIGNLTFCN